MSALGMSRGKRYGRQPGSDQAQQWADAADKYKRQQRQRRGKRKQALPSAPGMVHINPACPCVDCGVPTCQRGGEWYMVHDHVWQAAGMPAVATLRDYLCIGCLETRLGRQLTAADFTDADINDPAQSDMTPRLLARLGEVDGDHDDGDHADGHHPGPSGTA